MNPVFLDPANDYTKFEVGMRFRSVIGTVTVVRVSENQIVVQDAFCTEHTSTEILIHSDDDWNPTTEYTSIAGFEIRADGAMQ